MTRRDEGSTRVAIVRSPLMAAVAATQRSVRVLTTAAALGVGIFVVYLLLPPSTPKPRTFTGTLHPKLRRPLNGAVLAESEVGSSDKTHQSNSPANRSSPAQKDSVRHFHWPSEASSEASSQAPWQSQTPACKYIELGLHEGPVW